jgi:hypothetical protein
VNAHQRRIARRSANPPVIIVVNGKRLRVTNIKLVLPPSDSNLPYLFVPNAPMIIDGPLPEGYEVRGV